MEALTIILCIIAGLLLAYGIIALLDYFELKAENDIPDDGKPIKNVPLMQAHCKAVHTGISLYQALDCAICPYKEECKKYYKRYKKYPNGDK